MAIVNQLQQQAVDKRYSKPFFETLFYKLMMNNKSNIIRGKRRLSGAKKRSSSLKNNPEQFEKEAFVDRINEINFIVKEFRKMYDRSPVTDHSFRAKVLKQIKHTERILSKVQAEYEMFKKYKMRTAISK